METAVETPSPTRLSGAAAQIAAGLDELSRLSPPLAARLAALVFFKTPPPRRIAPEARAVFSQARPLSVSSRGQRLKAWQWGEGPPVLLLHGWGGRATQLWAAVEPLLAAGLSPVALDAPGHGESPGWFTNIPQIAEGVGRLSERLGPLHGVLAHSMGGSVTAFALRQGLSAPRVVMVGPAADPGSYLRAWLGRFAADPGLRGAVEAQVEAWVGAEMSALHVPTTASDRREALLVIHDRGDAEVPWADGYTISRAWPGAQLISTEGLGHRRILQDPDVLRAAVGFLAGAAAAGCEVHGEAAVLQMS